MSKPATGHRIAIAVVIALGACGAGAGSAPPPPLQAPPPSSSDPPSVNVNGLWQGTYSDRGESGAMALLLEQDGGSVVGSDSITEDRQRGGPIAATLAGNILGFNLQFGTNCVRTAGGTATVDGDTMTGSFTGQFCDAGAVTDGTFTLKVARPAAPALFGTTWLGGSPGLVGSTPGIFGADAWEWQFTEEGTNQDGIVGLGATVAEGPGGVGSPFVPESTGTLTGTLTQEVTCPGTISSCTPHYFWRLAFTAMLSGACPSTLSGTDDPTVNGEPFIGARAGELNGKLNGTTCRGAVASVGFVLDRQ